jgi:hypothetical protein
MNILSLTMCIDFKIKITIIIPEEIFFLKMTRKEENIFFNVIK